MANVRVRGYTAPSGPRQPFIGPHSGAESGSWTGTGALSTTHTMSGSGSILGANNVAVVLRAPYFHPRFPQTPVRIFFRQEAGPAGSATGSGALACTLFMSGTGGIVRNDIGTADTLAAQLGVSGNDVAVIITGTGDLIAGLTLPGEAGVNYAGTTQPLALDIQLAASGFIETPDSRTGTGDLRAQLTIDGTSGYRTLTGTGDLQSTFNVTGFGSFEVPQVHTGTGELVAGLSVGSLNGTLNLGGGWSREDAITGTWRIVWKRND